MRNNGFISDLETWVEHHAKDNFFIHNGELIDSEKAFNSEGLHAQAKPSYQDWLNAQSSSN